jgi:hypothetical protein
MRGSEGVAARENRGVTEFAFFFWRKVRLQSTEVVLSIDEFVLSIGEFVKLSRESSF